MAKIDDKTLFRVSLEKLDALYDTFETDVVNKIREMQAMGVSDKEIYRRLQENLRGNLDIFSKFKGALEKEIDSIVGKIDQLESNDVYGDTQKLRWELDPMAREHCDDCLRFAKDEPKTLSEWQEIGLPGFGNTECQEYCKCTLIATGI